MDAMQYLTREIERRTDRLRHEHQPLQSNDVDREIAGLTGSVDALCALGLVDPATGLGLIRDFELALMASRQSRPLPPSWPDARETPTVNPRDLLGVRPLECDLGRVDDWTWLRLVALQSWSDEFAVQYVGCVDTDVRPKGGRVHIQAWDDHGNIYRVTGQGQRSYKPGRWRGEWVLAPHLPADTNTLHMVFSGRGANSQPRQIALALPDP